VIAVSLLCGLIYATIPLFGRLYGFGPESYRSDGFEITLTIVLYLVSAVLSMTFFSFILVGIYDF
jgi:hypothetical protein